MANNEDRATHCAKMIEEVIGQVNDTVRSHIQSLILTQLQIAYRDGYEKAITNYAPHTEDMGR